MVVVVEASERVDDSLPGAEMPLHELSSALTALQEHLEGKEGT
jgi:hypothetical protein